MKIFDTTVIENTNMIYKSVESENYKLIKVKPNCNDNFDLGSPGQFYELSINNDQDFKLRVPISIYNIENNQIQFLIKIIGNGTKKLAQLKEGDTLNLFGPLGNTFDLKENNFQNITNLLFVTGGCGYAPLVYYKEYLRKHSKFSDINIKWIHGGKNKNEIFESDISCTDDGSYGIKGNVLESVENFITDYESKFNLKTLKIVGCGPKPMLIAVHKICSSMNIAFDVSLEEYMACGAGVCYGCAVKVINSDGTRDFKRVCKDGPVFNAYDIDWKSE